MDCVGPFSLLELCSVGLMEGHSGGSCGPVTFTHGFVVLQFPHNVCVMTLIVEKDYVVYENRILSTYEVSISPLGIITKNIGVSSSLSQIEPDESWHQGRKIPLMGKPGLSVHSGTLLLDLTN